MNSHFKLSNTEFEEQFKNCTLDPDLFSHEAHLRLAWIHIEKYGVDQAIENLCHDIKAFAESIGANTKFNKTVTVAAVRAVHHCMLRSGSEDFQTFIEKNNDLITDFKGLISSHYRTDIFNSEKARLEFLEPELLPFD